MAVDPRQWISCEHDGETWMFDVTFLTSNWVCIWDRGCAGVRTEPAPEAMEGCCAYGAHTSDDADRERVEAAALRLTPVQWQNHGRADAMFERDANGDWRTATVDDTCVFLNRPGFDGGPGCALHRGALAAGESHIEWKPEVCWQLPLRLEHHVDDNGHVVNVLRQWHRRDWGEGGDEFHAWCTEEDATYVGAVPVHAELRDEIRALIGAELGDWLSSQLEGRPTDTPVVIAARPTGA